jgi:GntR family transcriptional regulator, carbon starvation induced regulator
MIVILMVRRSWAKVVAIGDCQLTQTLTEQAYRTIRQDILWGELAPDSHIKIDDLRSRYGIGPTPIREALSRLVAESLVLSEAHRGFRVPRATMSDLEDIVAHRRLIECNALKSAIENGDDEWEAGIVASYHLMARVEERSLTDGAGSWEEWELLHRRFHEALTSGAHSAWSRNFLRVLYDQGDRYRRLYRPDEVVVPVIHDDHKRILDATLGRNVELAVKEMDRHIGRLVEGAGESGLI